MLALYILGGLVALVLVLGLIGPSKGVIRRSIVVNTSPEEAYAYIADYKNYLQWNPWTKMDPEATSTISEPSTGVGASWMWDGKKVGQGKLTTQKLEPGKSITSKLEFFKPFKALAEDSWTFEAEGAGTKLTWGYTGPNKFPVQRIFWLLMTQKMLTKQFDQGLAEIKKQVEAA